MKIAVLSIAPYEPIKNHESSFNHKDFDYFFVTHDKYNEKAINFNKGKKWAFNRNYLAEKFGKQNYDYFLFIDYDVEMKSQTNLSISEQIIKDLEDYNPAVLVYFDPKKSDYIKNPKDKVIPFLVSNNQIKIIHKDLINWFFPMETEFGSTWDTCHLFNMMEYPLKENVLMSYNITASGLYNGPESQPTNGQQGMVQLHNWFKQTQVKEDFSFKTHNDFKNHCLSWNKQEHKAKKFTGNYFDILKNNNFIKIDRYKL